MPTYRAPKELNPKAVSELGRQKILQTWIKSGIEDFYLSFEFGRKMAQTQHFLLPSRPREDLQDLPHWEIFKALG
jgi:hypothetical protein